MNSSRALGLAVAVLGTLHFGCGNTMQVIDCVPACPATTHCTTEGCVPDDNSVTDLAVVAADMAATCAPACSGATPYCNASRTCVPCLMDSHCPMGQICKQLGQTSACIPGCADDSRCAAPTHCCNGACLDTSKDVSNCGACGNKCSGQHATSTCVGGQCMAGACQAGWGDCNMNGADGCETSLRSDPNNCTACGMVCSIKNAIAGCADSEKPPCYIAACRFGYDDCNGDPVDGCETSVVSDAKNCGACGMACPAYAHAKVTCSNAACILTSCDQGFSDCDGKPANGCEITTGTDVLNCGACGNKCGQGQVCINSSCTCQNCVLPNAKTKCVNLACVFDQCLPGYLDCDNNQQNGCEVDPSADPKNCGGCGVVCPQNAMACINGKCTNSPCIGNPLWTPVTCTTMDWVWSMDSQKAKTVQDAAAARVLVTGCMHGTPQPQLGQGNCSLDGKGWVSTKTFVMAGCNNTWWHIGGRFSGQCGGHDGDLYRLLVLTDNDCYPY